MASFDIINPYSIQTIATYEYEHIKTCDQKIKTLYKESTHWKNTPIQIKKEWLIQLANQLQSHQKEFATLISTDMGKPIQESLNEVQKSIDCCHYFANEITAITDSLNHPKGARFPVGLVLGIMPWNFPLWQLIRFMIPTLIVGNTCMIKPAYNTYRIAKKLAEMPPSSPGVMDVIMPTDTDAFALIEHPLIGGVSFTGSASVGKKIGEKSGFHLKPCVLELGGSDAFIVYDDADLNAVIDHAIKARFSNAGQTCISAKRFLFHQNIFTDAIQLLSKKANKFLCFDDPLYSHTTIGPLARLDLKNRLIKQLDLNALSSSAIVYTYPKNNKGYFVAPMIINTQKTPSNHPILNNEIFGPIALCDSFKTNKEAIQKANQTPYGLGTSIWTNHSKHIEDAIKHIDCGNLAINQPVHSAFDSPFGGWKASGIGLELGLEGSHSFTRFKAIQTNQ